MDLKFEIKSHNSKMVENYSYLNSSVSDENSSYIMQQKNYKLEYQLKKACLENEKLKKHNKILSSKIEFLVNNNTVVKNVKNEMNDCSQISHFKNQDSLREFFYLLVICEKMNYLNQDQIWKIDSNSLYKEVLELDLNFYQWQNFIKIKIESEMEKNSEFQIEVERKKSDQNCWKKLKNIWTNTSCSFFDNLKDTKKANKKLSQAKIKDFKYFNTKGNVSNSTNCSSNKNLNLKKSNDVVNSEIPFIKMDLEMMNKTDKEIYKKIERNKKNNEIYFGLINSNSSNKSTRNTNKDNSFNVPNPNINSNEPDDLENLLRLENESSFMLSDLEAI